MIPGRRSEAEIERLEDAMRKSRAELAELQTHIRRDAPPSSAAFLDLHRMILDDSALSEAPQRLIRERRANAEWALVQEMERARRAFDEIDDAYLRERKADVVRRSSAC